jgi:hypothetical protein
LVSTSRGVRLWTAVVSQAAHGAFAMASAPTCHSSALGLKADKFLVAAISFAKRYNWFVHVLAAIVLEFLACYCCHVGMIETDCRFDRSQAGADHLCLAFPDANLSPGGRAAKSAVGLKQLHMRLQSSGAASVTPNFD